MFENEDQPVVLIKFLISEFVDSFVKDGLLYMRTIDYFRNIENEDISLRGDVNEGVASFYQGENAVLKFSGQEVSAVSMKLRITKKHELKTNLFCMTAITVADLIKADGEFHFPNEFVRFGDKAVLFYGDGLSKFLDRVSAHAHENESVFSHPESDKFAHKVEYVNESSFSGDLGVFRKFDKYAWQHEWRLVVKQKVTNSAFDGFRIGDLSDIAVVVDTLDLLKEPIVLHEE